MLVSRLPFRPDFTLIEEALFYKDIVLLVLFAVGIAVDFVGACTGGSRLSMRLSKEVSNPLRCIAKFDKRISATIAVANIQVDRSKKSFVLCTPNI